MNYRHHFHAGNFADVAKHALLVQLLRGLQKKEKGFLYLDTHAGRGAYDLAVAARGDTLVRKPEWPDGIGRLLRNADLPPELVDYVSLVQQFDRERASDAATQDGPAAGAIRHYPGSPWIARMLLRPQDRLALCEKHPEEWAALCDQFTRAARTLVREMDGYEAVRAMLPPPERRALVLVDPPFESQDEFALMATAVDDALKRFPSGVLAMWYPLTERARIDAFFERLRGLALPPTLIAELAVAGDASAIKMKGCGLVVINPPWQLDRSAATIMSFLADVLAQEPGGGGCVTWLVPEK